MHAGAPQFQHLTGKIRHRGNIVLIGRVEPADPGHRLGPDQPIGRHHALRPRPDRVVNHQQMVRNRVIGIDVASQRRRHLARAGAHFLIEHAVAQRLHGIDLGSRGGESRPQIAGTQLAESG